MTPRTITLPIPDDRFTVNAEVARDVMAATVDGGSHYGRGGDLPHPDESDLHALYFQVLAAALRTRALLDEVGTASRLVRQTIDAALAEAGRTGPDSEARVAGLLIEYRELTPSGHLWVHWRKNGRVTVNNAYHGDTLFEALTRAIEERKRRAGL